MSTDKRLRKLESQQQKELSKYVSKNSRLTGGQKLGVAAASVGGLLLGPGAVVTGGGTYLYNRSKQREKALNSAGYSALKTKQAVAMATASSALKAKDAATALAKKRAARKAAIKKKLSGIGYKMTAARKAALKKAQAASAALRKKFK